MKAAFLWMIALPRKVFLTLLLEMHSCLATGALL
jgi:hypothetical protein